MHGGSGETACKMYEFQGTNEHKQSNDLTHNYENEVDFKVTMSLQKKKIRICLIFPLRFIRGNAGEYINNHAMTYCRSTNA